MASFSTSASLLIHVRRMEQSAWERLCDLYGPVVYAWCRRAGLQESDTSDTAQEVFRAVFLNIDRFKKEKPTDSFRGWLWTITRNQIRLRHRRHQTQVNAQGGSDALQQIAQTAAPDLLEEEPADDEERRRIIHRALEMVRSDFAERTWTIFERTTLQQQSNQEVAEDLGVKVNAIRQARFRVLCRLREELDGLL